MEQGAFFGCLWQPYPEFARPEGSNMYGSCWWQVQGDMFVIAPAFGTSGELADWGVGNGNYPPWWCQFGTAKHVEVRGHVKAATCFRMFRQCWGIESVDLAGLDTTGVSSMAEMFYDCRVLESADLSGFDASSVTSMANMFSQCYALHSVDLSSFKTPALSDMYAMFHECNSLTGVDLSTFDLSSVTSAHLMFYNCSSLESRELPC